MLFFFFACFFRCCIVPWNMYTHTHVFFHSHIHTQPREALAKGIYVFLPSLKLTWPLKIGLPKRKFHLPTIHVLVKFYVIRNVIFLVVTVTVPGEDPNYTLYCPSWISHLCAPLFHQISLACCTSTLASLERGWDQAISENHLHP